MANKVSRRPISLASVEPFTLLCQQLVTALEESRLYEETQAREREATRLYELTGELASSLDMNRVLEQITAKAVEVFESDASAIILQYDPVREGLVIIRETNLRSAMKETVVRPGEGVSARAFAERRPVWTRDPLAQPGLKYS